MGFVNEQGEGCEGPGIVRVEVSLSSKNRLLFEGQGITTAKASAKNE